jgi:hypothetical protein|tara:strand:- start:1725 stop:2111 length:387 start_codon:yes stop_codon:yes gene_type:complete
MQQFFIAIILVLGIGCWWLYSENQTLTENNYKLELAVEEQKETIRVIQENFERQANALQNMSRKNAEIEAEKQRYLDIFARHNVERLATVKPGLIENRFNQGTIDVFEGIENDTKEISNTDTTESTND